MLAMAGTVVFVCLGCGLALGLALLDDRVYRRADIDDLGIAPVLVVIPRSKKKKRFRRG
jgi:capsular polysaccharide biosynthesis protein